MIFTAYPIKGGLELIPGVIGWDAWHLKVASQSLRSTFIFWLKTIYLFSCKWYTSIAIGQIHLCYFFTLW